MMTRGKKEDELLADDTASSLQRMFSAVPHNLTIAPFLVSGKASCGRLALLGVAGFALVAVPSLIDGVFWPGSLDSIDPELAVQGAASQAGMSFIGDTMVWPFCFLVPLAILTTISLARQFLAVVERPDLPARLGVPPQLVAQARSAAWQCLHLPPSPLLVLPLWCPRRAWLVRQNFWLWLAVVGAVLVVVYNAMTCGFPTICPELTYAYSMEGDDGVSLVPKWDCGAGDHLLSNLFSRVWTLYFYVVTPFLFYAVLSLVLAARRFVRTLHEQMRTVSASWPGDLPAMLMGADVHAGLGGLAGFGFYLFLFMSELSVMVLLALFKEATPPSFHNYFLMVIVISGSLVALSWPAYFSSRFLRFYYDALLDWISLRLDGRGAVPEEDEARVIYDRDFLWRVRDDLAARSTRIYESHMLFKVFGILAIPVLGLVLQIFFRVFDLSLGG